MYSWKLGSRYRQNAGDMVAWLEKVRAGGGLTAEAVVTAAKKESSPAHFIFQWDDVSAAHQYRLSQARQLMRSVVRGDDENLLVRVYSNLVVKGDRVYIPTRDALRNKVLRSQLIGSAIRDADIFMRRYRDLEELAEIMGVMSRARKHLAKKYLPKQPERRV